MVIVKWCWRLIILMNFSLTSILDLWDWVVKYFATFKCWPIWDYQTIKEIQNCLKFKFMCSDWHSAITCERKFQNDTRLTFWISYSNMHHFPAYVKAGLKDLINNYSHCDTRSFANSSLRAFSQENWRIKFLKLIIKIWINFDHQNYIKIMCLYFIPYQLVQKSHRQQVQP